MKWQLSTEANLNDHLTYVKGLPLNDDPSLFGLHANADISCALAETSKALSTLLSIQPKLSVSEASSQEEVTGKMAKIILSKIPGKIDLQSALAK